MTANRPGPFNDNDRYQVGILADFAGVAVVNTWLIEDLKAHAAAAAETPVEAPEATPGRAYVPIMKESVAEAERLSRELRNLASAAQVLAARLQVHSGSS